MTPTPIISVVMSVYNGEQHLREAIESILNQSFQDFEFIIVNDGSNDATKQILESCTDKRLVVIHQENAGLTKALNTGLSSARGAFIARQDADDLSKPQRLEMQLAYMKEHPEVGLLGTRFDFIDENGDLIRNGLLPLENKVLQERLPEINQFCHGSVLIRREALGKVGHYREFFRYAQDYDLWLRIAEHFEVANLAEPLCSYRELSTAISSDKILIQSRYAAAAAEMARQRRRSGTDLILQGKNPALPDAESFSKSLQKKMSTFYCQHPATLLAGLQLLDDPDLPLFLQLICRERLQYEDELRQNNEQLRHSSERLNKQDAKIRMMHAELEQSRQHLDCVKSAPWKALEESIAGVASSARENRELLARLASQFEEKLTQRSEDTHEMNRVAGELSDMEEKYKKKCQELDDKGLECRSLRDEWQQEKMKLEANAAQLDERIREMTETVSHMHAQLSEQSDEISSKDEKLQRLESAAGEARRRHEEQLRLADEQLVHIRQELEQVEQQLLVANGVSQRLERSLQEKSQALQGLQEQLVCVEEEKQARIGRYEQQLGECEEHIRSLLNSRSWHVTAPLRAVGSMFKK